MTQLTISSRWVACVALTTASILWSTNLIIGRAVAEDIPPVLLTTGRWLIAFLVVLFIARKDILRVCGLIGKHKHYFLLTSITGIVFFHTPSYWGLHYAQAKNGLIILAISPLLVPLWMAITSHERLSYIKIVSIFLSAGGAMLVITDGSFTGINFSRGDLAFLLATCMWSSYTILSKSRPSEINNNDMMLGTLGTALLFLIPACAVEGWWLGGLPELSMGHFGVILYLAVFPSLMAFYLYNAGIRVLGPSMGALFIYVMPVSGLTLAVLFLNEYMLLIEWAGILLLAAGLWLGLKKSNNKIKTPLA